MCVSYTGYDNVIQEHALARVEYSDGYRRYTEQPVGGGSSQVLIADGVSLPPHHRTSDMGSVHFTGTYIVYGG